MITLPANGALQMYTSSSQLLWCMTVNEVQANGVPNYRTRGGGPIATLNTWVTVYTVPAGVQMAIIPHLFLEQAASVAGQVYISAAGVYISAWPIQIGSPQYTGLATYDRTGWKVYDSQMNCITPP